MEYQSEAPAAGGDIYPYAFTEHGVVMLCSVLKSERPFR
jgi:hypothetical protein